MMDDVDILVVDNVDIVDNVDKGAKLFFDIFLFSHTFILNYMR